MSETHRDGLLALMLLVMLVLVLVLMIMLLPLLALILLHTQSSSRMYLDLRLIDLYRLRPTFEVLSRGCPEKFPASKTFCGERSTER